MAGLEDILHRPGQSATGRGVVPTLWRGTIVEAYEDGTVSATVPTLLGDQAIRMQCGVAGLGPGDRVLVAAIEGRISDLIVILPG